MSGHQCSNTEQKNIIFPYLDNARNVRERCIGEFTLLHRQHLQLELSDVVREDAKALVTADGAVSDPQPHDRCAHRSKTCKFYYLGCVSCSYS